MHRSPVFLCLIISLKLIAVGAAFAQETDYQKQSLPSCRKDISLASEGKFDQAKEAFVLSLKDDPSDDLAISSLGMLKELEKENISQEYARSFFQGLEFLHLGDMDQALALLKESIGLQPEYAKTYNVLAMVYAAGGNIQEAEQMFDKALELDPGYLDARYNLAAFYQSQEESHKAIEQYEKILNEDSGYTEAAVNLASLMADLEDYKEAIRIYTDLLKDDSSNADLHYRLGLVYLASEDVFKAKEELEKADSLYRKSGDSIGIEATEAYLDTFNEIASRIRNPR